MNFFEPRNTWFWAGFFGLVELGGSGHFGRMEPLHRPLKDRGRGGGGRRG